MVATGSACAVFSAGGAAGGCDLAQVFRIEGTAYYYLGTADALGMTTASAQCSSSSGHL